MYQFLRKKAEAGNLPQGEKVILEKVEIIVKKGAEGLLEGGFHTPSHRWVIASVLMTCGKLFCCREMEDAAYEYLREGIDCGEDGEFSEKSAGNYNRINNDAMIMLSKTTGDDSYEQYAVRNLRMMLTYWEVEGTYVRPDFCCFYEKSQIARGQQGRFTYTVLGGKSNFFYLHNGTMKLEMKVAGSFCEHRAFRSEQMERLSDGEYYLSQTMRGWYYLPFAEKPETSDWWEMDNESRDKKYGPDMQIDVWVREVENGVNIRVKTSGVEGAPWRIELAFSGVNFLTNDSVDMLLTGSEVLVIKQGYIKVSNGQDALTVGPCFGEHHFTEGKEDSEAKTPGAATLYLTDFTSFDHTIEIRNSLVH